MPAPERALEPAPVRGLAAPAAASAAPGIEAEAAARAALKERSEAPAAVGEAQATLLTAQQGRSEGWESAAAKRDRSAQRTASPPARRAAADPACRAGPPREAARLSALLPAPRAADHASRAGLRRETARPSERVRSPVPVRRPGGGPTAGPERTADAERTAACGRGAPAAQEAARRDSVAALPARRGHAEVLRAPLGSGAMLPPDHRAEKAWPARVPARAAPAVAAGRPVPVGRSFRASEVPRPARRREGPRRATPAAVAAVPPRAVEPHSDRGGDRRVVHLRPRSPRAAGACASDRARRHPRALRVRAPPARSRQRPSRGRMPRPSRAAGAQRSPCRRREMSREVSDA